MNNIRDRLRYLYFKSLFMPLNEDGGTKWTENDEMIEMHPDCHMTVYRYRSDGCIGRPVFVVRLSRDCGVSEADYALNSEVRQGNEEIL